MEITDKNHGIPDAYRHCDFEKIKNVEPVREWIRNNNGFLFIYGPTGTGKTHLVCAIKKRCNELGLGCRLVFTPDLFLKIKNTFNSETERAEDIIFNLSPTTDVCTGLSFTIFDDIGAQKVTEYTKDVWYQIIDRRSRFGYKTIFTSNYKLSEISEIMNDRIASRLASGYNFEINGSDRRIENIADRDLTKIF